VGTEDLTDPSILQSKSLKLKIGGELKNINFPRNLTTQTYMIAVINTELAKGNNHATAGWMDSKYLVIQSTAKGDAASIEVRGDGGASDAAVDIGWFTGQRTSGAGTYQNLTLGISYTTAFPAPRGNLSYLDFSSLEDEILCYHKSNGAFNEFARDAALLRYIERPEGPFGFSLLNPPEDFDIDAVAGLNRDTNISRDLEAIDDGDGDSVTPKVASVGEAASTEKTFNKVGQLVLLFGTSTKAAIHIVSNNENLAGYLANRFSFVVAAHAGDDTVEIVSAGTDSLTTATWTVTYSYAASKKVSAAVDYLNGDGGDTPIPGTAELLGLEENLSLAEAFTFLYEGPAVDSVSVSAVTEKTVSDGETATVVTSANPVNGETSGILGRWGSVGNYLTLQYVTSESTGTTAALAYDAGGGTGPADLKNATLECDEGTHAISYFQGTGGVGNLILTATDAYAGTMGAKVYYTLTVSGAVDSVTVTQTFGSDGTLATIEIVQLASASTDIDTVKAAILANDLAAAIVTPTSEVGATVMVSKTRTQLGAGATGSVAASDGCTVATAIEAIETGDAGITEFLADHTGQYDSTCPINEPYWGDFYDDTAVPLEDGWDPINFREYVGKESNAFNHAVVVGSADLTGAISGLSGTTLVLRFNGLESQTVTFAESDGEAGGQAIADKINSYFPAEVATIIDATYPTSKKCLRLSSQEITTLSLNLARTGQDSSIEIVGGTAIESILASESEETTAYTGVFFGSPLPVKEGDVLWDNGLPVGTVVTWENYEKGGLTFPNAVLVLDTEVAAPGEGIAGATYTGWYLRSMNIDFENDSGTSEAYGPMVDPVPEAFVDTLNQLLVLKPYVDRTSTGFVPSGRPFFSMYVSYRALRKDLTEGVSIASVNDLDSVSPLTASNPLGLALQLAFSSSNGTIVYGYGVDEVSELEPSGTRTAYQSSLNWLQGQDAYALAPLTTATAVHDDFKSHAETMSDEDHKSERICLVCPTIPHRKSSTTAGTGKASRTSTTVLHFDAGELNVQKALTDIGVTSEYYADMASFGDDEKIYIDVSTDASHFLVKSVDVGANNVTVYVDDTWWATHEGNEDGFYYAPESGGSLPDMSLSGETCSILQRGESFENADGTLDTEECAIAMGEWASHYNSIRVRMIGPDSIELPIEGLSSRVSGTYATAIAAAQVCGNPPSNPLTGAVVPVLTNAYLPSGMSDYERGIAANGGYCLIVNDNGIITWRDFVTTKTSPIEDFEHSMITPDDVAAKLFRQELRPYVGPLSIDSGYLGKVSMVADSVCTRLVSSHIYQSASPKGVAQSASDKRQVIVTIERSIYYPARSILVILI
jgi:hypothetical protein